MKLPFLLYDPSRHGRPRWYVRVKGVRKRVEGVDTPPPFPATEAALTAYWAARGAVETPGKIAADTSSLAWLVDRYIDSPAFKRLNDLTQRDRRSTYRRICEAHGHKPFSMMETRHVAQVRDEAAGGNAANRRVECMRALFKWALSQGHASRNPAKEAEFVRVVSEGYRAWSREDILAFEKRHLLGTKARLALALFLYTGQRRSDVVQLGPLNLRRDRLVYLQHKGRGIKPKRRDIPLVPPLRAVLDASPLGDTTFLETEYGKPFSIAGFGNWFRDRCDEAGLQGLSAHGIRKAVGVIAAERGCTAHQIMAILGHDTLEEAERYTRQASQIALANEGFSRAFGDEG